MDHHISIPPSPGSTALFSLFTTLCDDESRSEPEMVSTSDTDYSSTSIAARRLNQQSMGATTQGSSLTTVVAHSAERGQGSQNPRPKRKSPPGYICFSSVTGEDAQPPKRANFSEERRNEVKRVRKLGACLRCKLRKISCSGEDPCKSCLSLAQTEIGSKALRWMECIRPSFEAVSIFNQESYHDHATLGNVMRHILGREDPPVISTPFEVNLESASSQLIGWLVEGTNQSSYSIAGLLRSIEFSNMLNATLGTNFSDSFRLMVYLCNDVSTRTDSDMYNGHTAEDLHRASHYAGNAVLRAVDRRLRPAHLEATKNKLDELRSLLLVVFGISVTVRYMYLNTILRAQDVSIAFKTRTEDFVRLLNHYMLYIGGLLNIVDAPTQDVLASQCSLQWDRPGSSVRSWVQSSSSTPSDILNDDSMVPEIGSFKPLETVLPNFKQCNNCHTTWSNITENGLCKHCQPVLPSDTLDMLLADTLYEELYHDGSTRSSLKTQGGGAMHYHPWAFPQFDEGQPAEPYYAWGGAPGKVSALLANGEHRPPLSRARGKSLKHRVYIPSSEEKHGNPLGLQEENELREDFEPFLDFDQIRSFEINNDADSRTSISTGGIRFPDHSSDVGTSLLSSEFDRGHTPAPSPGSSELSGGYGMDIGSRGQNNRETVVHTTPPEYYSREDNYYYSTGFGLSSPAAGPQPTPSRIRSDSQPYSTGQPDSEPYYALGGAPGRFSALLTRYASYTDTAPKQRRHADHRVVVPQDYRRSGKYWTFYNQNKPFEIHSEVNQRSLTNAAEEKPKQHIVIDLKRTRRTNAEARSGDRKQPDRSSDSIMRETKYPRPPLTFTAPATDSQRRGRDVDHQRTGERRYERSSRTILSGSRGPRRVWSPVPQDSHEA